MENRFTNNLSNLDQPSPGLSGWFDDIFGKVGDTISGGVAKIDETNANIKTTNETVNKLYTDYKTIQPYVIGFCLLLTGYLATGLIVNYNDIRRNGRK